MPITSTRPPDRSSVIIIDNSPIDFVLVGPRGEGPGVLLRTKNAGLDLTGACSDISTSKEFQYRSEWINLLGDRYSRTISTVSSNPTSIGRLVDDERLGSLTFAWLGATKSAERKKIEEQFNNRITDLQNAIAQIDQERIEWFLGPIVALCLLAEYRHRLYRALNRVVIFSWLFLVGLLVLFMLLRASRHWYGL
jgi:hypothetical protein